MFTTVEGLPAVGVTCLSPGVGAMVGQIEHQMHLGGASRFVVLNSAGAIGPDVSLGSVVVVTTAVRDDGVSQHYLPPDTYVDADRSLSEDMLSTMTARGIDASEAATWTLPRLSGHRQRRFLSS